MLLLWIFVRFNFDSTPLLETTSQNRPISKAQKLQKDFKVSKNSLLQYPDFFRKVSQCQKTEGGPFGISPHPFCRKTPKKLKGNLLGKVFFRKKSLEMAKKLKREPLISSGNVCYAGKFFWFSSLGQQVQFGVLLKFCRTFGRTILVT